MNRLFFAYIPIYARIEKEDFLYYFIIVFVTTLVFCFYLSFFLVPGRSALSDCCLYWLSSEPACRKSENSWGEILKEGEHCQHGDWSAQLQGGDHCFATQNMQKMK